MQGLWLVSYVVLWILAITAGLVILALSQEIESLNKKLDSLMKIISSPEFNKQTNKGQKKQKGDKGARKKKAL